MREEGEDCGRGEMREIGEGSGGERKVEREGVEEGRGWYGEAGRRR